MKLCFSSAGILPLTYDIIKCHFPSSKDWEVSNGSFLINRRGYHPFCSSVRHQCHAWGLNGLPTVLVWILSSLSMTLRNIFYLDAPTWLDEILIEADARIFNGGEGPEFQVGHFPSGGLEVRLSLVKRPSRHQFSIGFSLFYLEPRGACIFLGSPPYPPFSLKSVKGRASWALQAPLSRKISAYSQKVHSWGKSADSWRDSR